MISRPPPAARHSRVPPFETVVAEHGRLLLRYCVARLGADRGQDAFQETLLAALRAYDQLRDARATRAWLMTIAQRQVIDRVRADARSPLPVDDLEPLAGATVDAVPDGLWGQVAALPPKQREAVALRYVADLPHADVAQVMGISVDAARRNVHEGLRSLARTMEVPS